MKHDKTPHITWKIPEGRSVKKKPVRYLDSNKRWPPKKLIPPYEKHREKEFSNTHGKSCTASAEASTTLSIFLIQSLLIKVSAKIKKNLAPLIVTQFSETLTRPLMGIQKILILLLTTVSLSYWSYKYRKTDCATMPTFCFRKIL